jgi:hypothetical protein
VSKKDAANGDAASRPQTPIRSPHRSYVPPPNTEITILPQSPLINKKIQVGNHEFGYGLRIGEMVDSTELYRTGDRAGLRARLDDQGYIFIRGGIAPERARRAREALLNHLKPKGAFAEGTDIDDAIIAHPREPGWTIDAETGGIVAEKEPDEMIDGWRDLAWSPALRDVYAGDDLRKIYEFVWGPARTEGADGYNMLSDVTWIRAKGRGEATAEHADYYYFKGFTSVFRDNRHPYISRDAEMWNDKNVSEELLKSPKAIACDLCSRVFDRTTVTPAVKAGYDRDDDGEWHCVDCARQHCPVYTCWMSLGEYHSGNSSLCVMPKSQCLTEYHAPSKDQLLPGDYPRLVKEKWGWERGDFNLGDIVLFNVKTVHGASKNLNSSYRLSMDTRVSARWFRPAALYGDEAKTSLPFDRAPAQLSEAFMTENAAARKAAEEAKDALKGLVPKRVKKGMSGRGMGMGMGGGAAPSASGKRTADAMSRYHDDSDLDGDDEEAEEVKAADKKPRSARAMGM